MHLFILVLLPEAQSPPHIHLPNAATLYFSKKEIIVGYNHSTKKAVNNIHLGLMPQSTPSHPPSADQKPQAYQALN
jgi:hypothetical protein